MARKAIIELKPDGPMSYSVTGKPRFVRGVPQPITDEEVIDWAMTEGFLEVTFPEPEIKPEPVPEKKLALPPVKEPSPVAELLEPSKLEPPVPEVTKSPESKSELKPKVLKAPVEKKVTQKPSVVKKTAKKPKRKAKK